MCAGLFNLTKREGPCKFTQTENPVPLPGREFKVQVGLVIEELLVIIGVLLIAASTTLVTKLGTAIQPLPQQFDAAVHLQECTHKVSKSASKAVLSRMQLTLHVTRRRPYGASC